MAETTLRYLSMLSLIPQRPRKVTARELHAQLAAEGFETHVRSVERDLHSLSHHFPLVSDDGRPAGWSWNNQGPSRRYPHMDTHTALAYELFSRYLTPVLPRALRRQLEPDFAEARNVLDNLRASPLGKWSKRIAVLPPGQQLLSPEVSDGVTDVVHDALLKGLRFEADYRSMDADAPKRYVFNPQGLVYRHGTTYLVANLFDYDDVRVVALHRMSKATLLDAPAKALKGFDLQRYIHEDKTFDIPVGESIQLELHMSAWLARHLDESRLSRDQVITPIRGSDRFRLTATVLDTGQLHWWLRSFGAEVEVLKPASLRRGMAKEAAATAEMYRQP